MGAWGEAKGEEDEPVCSLIPGSDLGQLCHGTTAIHDLLCVGQTQGFVCLLNQGSTWAVALLSYPSFM